MSLAHVFHSTARALRKLRKGRPFNRAKAAKPLKRAMAAWWSDGLDALFSYLWLSDGWEKIQRHVQMAQAAEIFTVSKALTDSDRKFVADLLQNFDYFSDRAMAEKALEILAGTSVATFEAAGAHALGQIGVASSHFELRNEAIRERLLERSEAAVFSTRSFIDEAMQSITNHFVELGQHPFSADGLEQLREALSYKTGWEAQRFALTETGIAAELAQAETYRRNGVGAKQWNITGINTRPTHAALAGKTVAIEQKFNVGGNGADHPLDPSLPPAELVNCHCYLSPVVDEDFEVNVEGLWEGQ